MPVLTLIMPTKNRLNTATSTARCLAQLASEDVEIVIQDASSDAGLGGWLSEQGLRGRVAYAHDAGAGSMADNWNRAIRRATGDYICIIGDDDGADARIVDLARWAGQHRMLAVTFPHTAYVWKDFPSKHAGNLMLGTYTGTVERLRSDAELRRVLRTPLRPIDRLAQSYHGLVARALYQELERRTGCVFDSLAPDYYTAVMLTALAADQLAYVDYPFTMHGSSRASNSGRSRTGGLSEHMREYGGFELSDILPAGGRNQSLSILFIAQAMLLALQRLERPDLLAEFNLATVYGAALITNPLDLMTLLRKLILASRHLGRVPARDQGALPRETARAAFVLAKSLLIHSLVPASTIESRGFRFLEAADVNEAIQRQAEALSGMKAI